MNFDGIYNGKNVLVTGHTGFKGSWLTYWLLNMGANVTGVSLPPEAQPAHFNLLKLANPSSQFSNAFCDIRDLPALQKVVHKAQPEIVFHLAAQPLVRRSYHHPVETFGTNVQGTVHLLEACRWSKSVRAVVIITSDKCYENREWYWGYRESDSMGGYDPYSASKGCAELVTASWRNSFYHPDQYGKNHHTLLASARAGNVIGGGDWGEDRLIPDIVRAIEAGKAVIIRNPTATRPWQHVLEPLSGYLLLGQKLVEGKKEFAQAWNFGPPDEGTISVSEVVRIFKEHWDAFEYNFKPDPHQPHEAGLLKLDCSMAKTVLKWRSVWDSSKTVEKTAQWYKDYYSDSGVRTGYDLNEYIKTAHRMNVCWAKENDTDISSNLD